MLAMPSLRKLAKLGRFAMMLQSRKRSWGARRRERGRRRREQLPILAMLPVIFCLAHAAIARRFEVGPDRALTAPSLAAARAGDGDTIAIDPGQYHDCAVWSANQLTITGIGAGAVITGESCEGKALFVIKGANTLVRNLIFTGARVADGNGAGIRAEGRNLFVESCRFIDNQDAILTANSLQSTIAISDSTFSGNGKDARPWGHGVYVGHIALLRIVHSRFFENGIGHQVKSRALRTELIADDIEDGRRGTSSFLVDIPNGGALLMRDNVLEKGPHSSNARAAIVIGEEGALQPTPELAFVSNRFMNDQSRTTVFVRNLTEIPADLRGNALDGPVDPLLGPGTVR
jgi:parallel beta helix pectate lyase-like protein